MSETVIGTETEFGVLRSGSPGENPIQLSAEVVRAYPGGRPELGVPSVEWDYWGEDPLNDLRGFRLPRAAAHPSQLTDDPNRPAPPLSM